MLPVAAAGLLVPVGSVFGAVVNGFGIRCVTASSADERPSDAT